jgi:hypothetical protein
MHFLQSLTAAISCLGVTNAAVSQAFTWKNVRIGGMVRVFSSQQSILTVS